MVGISRLLMRKGNGSGNGSGKANQASSSSAPAAPPGLRFTWRRPGRFISNWPKSTPAPLPKVYDQKGRDICMPVVIVEAMESKMMIAAALHDGPPAIVFSRQQLIDAWERIDVRKRFLSVLLNWVKKNGLVADEHYVDGKIDPPDAPRYHFLTWEGFDPKEAGYAGKIKTCLRTSTIIAELLMKAHYDESGKERYYPQDKEGNEELVFHKYSEAEDDKLEAGHAVQTTNST